ncbi:hypothetical protein [Bacillus sp. CDB3]|nr:hypothetical protein [Bacillus sp. CDB3]
MSKSLEEIINALENWNSSKDTKFKDGTKVVVLKSVLAQLKTKVSLMNM